MAATLTPEMKQDLFIGNSQLALIPYDKDRAATPTDFSEADVLYTVEGTFNVDEGNPSVNVVRLDQKHEIIDGVFGETPEYTLSGDIPSINLALMSYFFEEGTAVTGVTSPDGDFTYAGKSYGAAKTVEVTALAVSQNKKTAVIFNKVRLRLSRPKITNNTDPLVMSFLGVASADNKGAVITPLPTATKVTP